MSKWRSWTSDQFICLISEKKTEAVTAYLIKNSKGEGGGGGGGGRGGMEVGEATRMISALRWAAMRAILMFQ